MKQLWFLFFISFLHAEIDILHLKGTYNGLQETPCEFLSPLIGAITYHADWIKNFYQFGDHETACVKLARMLFYYNTETHEFAITKSKTSLAVFLVNRNQTHLFIKWYLLNKKSLEELASDKNSKNFAKQKFNQKRNKWFQESKEQFLKLLQETDPSLEKLPDERSLNKIEQAYYELHQENTPFPPFVLDQILATYWFMAQPDASTISGYMHLLGKTEISPDSYSANEVNQFTKKDLQNQEMLGIYLLQTCKKGHNPPDVLQGSRRYESYNAIPDCVETTLRNFFNLILFDGEKYNFNNLPEDIQKTVHPQLLNFYQQFPIEKTLHEETGQAWFNLIASLKQETPSIAYHKDICEVFGDEENVIKIINHLLGVEAHEFKDYAHLLSTTDQHVTVYRENGIYKLNINMRAATFSFSNRHADCVFVKTPMPNLNEFFQSHTPFHQFLKIFNPTPLLTGDYLFDHHYVAPGYNHADQNMLVSLVESIVGMEKHDNQENYDRWVIELLENLRKGDYYYYFEALGKVINKYDDLSHILLKFMREQASNEDLLFLGARYGMLHHFIEQIIQNGIDLNNPHPQFPMRETALTMAIRYEKLSAIQILLDHGAKISSDDLNQAIETANLMIIEALLKKGQIKKNWNHSHKAPLPLASRMDLTEVVKLLIRYDINIDENDGDCTALMKAVIHRNEDLVKFLLDKNADINIRNLSNDTALDIALKKDFQEIASLLKQSGAKLNININDMEIAIEKKDHAKVKLLLDHGMDVNISNEWGKTPLMLASEKGFIEIVQLLTTYKADLNKQDKNGKTALMLAIINRRDEVASFLIDNGADITIISSDFGHHDASSLAVNYSKETLKLLLKHPLVDLFKIAKHGVIYNKLAEVVHMMNEEEQIDLSSLLRLILKQKKRFIDPEDIAAELLKYEINVNKENQHNQTALMYAANNGYEKSVEKLIQKGAQINAQDKKGYTALMTAIIGNQPTIVTMLLKHDADTSLKNSEGDTAFTLAKKINVTEIIEILEEAMKKQTSNKKLS